MRNSSSYFSQITLFFFLFVFFVMQAQPGSNRYAQSYDTIVKQSGNKKELTVLNAEKDFKFLVKFYF
jgi:hypothetical protein